MTPRTDTLTLAKALEQIATDMDCEDGIATAAMQEAAERLRELAGQEWQPIDKAPKEGVFLVYLASEMMGSRIHAAHWHPNVKTIGSTFHFDAPKPTHWARQPKAPQ